MKVNAKPSFSVPIYEIFCLFAESWTIIPGFSQTYWPLNYIEQMYRVTNIPIDLELDFEWNITSNSDSGFFFTSFSTADCRNKSIPLLGFTVDCGNGDILFSATEPFTNPVNLTFTANGPRFSFSFTLQLGTIGKIHKAAFILVE